MSKYHPKLGGCQRHTRYDRSQKKSDARTCYLLQGLTDRGIAIVVGVVLDPKGPYHKWHSSLVL
ncbi:MAG: hypothetical protein DLM72_21265 [Candidatus Nitrosopolaris wilkensis]|nr:MAG: hypothetical protein DLM72_21265 [Candidatus Nitrosopolaris wilkensis]